MNNFFKSGFIRVEIEVIRFLDQFKRKVTGLPSLSTSQITSNLFVGGQYKISVFEKIKSLGITAIVNMRTISVHSGKDIPGILYLHLPTPDRQAPSMEHLEQGVKFIQSSIENGGKVYIHCKAGEGRGPTMAAAYLIHSGLNLDDALETIRKARRFIRPTTPQINQLKKFEAHTNHENNLP